MNDIAFEMMGISKKFKKGEYHDSLRDLIPAFTRKLVLRQQKDVLRGQEFWALRNISFQVRKGEAFGIIGPNGAGKSTILKLLSGIIRPTSGSMQANGRLSALIEVGAGFHQDLTGRENIYLNGTILGMKKEEIRSKFDEIVDFSGLADFIDTPVKRYSSGMYARLGFSVAAHVDPDILIVDEVLSVGDYVFQNKCQAKMRSIIKSGKATVIFVSHNLRAVADLCKRSLLLDHGEIVKIGQTSEVIQQYLNLGQISVGDNSTKEVYVSGFRLYGHQGDDVRFESGEKLFCEVEVAANRGCDKLSLSIFIEDDNYYNVFDTSSERLDQQTFSLMKGEKRKCTFELTLHLAPGVYRIGTHVYRYDIQKMYDRRSAAGTIYVSTEKDVRGVANLYPRFSRE